ncbi:putative pectinesterase/pectinesterase inhibitor 51 [Heracleum sosnowskyi]|uniref:pectinesterase n=1 Tax=Heracleum sosnowskyi TaxID=360622 RepID=A0AAD8HSH1_9APIA|nr:putative pectinesterase/pectinesterase inhibitor 51 [Heracleum sosnowskyi]
MSNLFLVPFLSLIIFSTLPFFAFVVGLPSATPAVPATPPAPATPAAPGALAAPAMPSAPATNDAPVTPATPAVPATPAAPGTPATPAAPATPATMAPAPGPGGPEDALVLTVEQAALLPFIQPACNGTRTPQKCIITLAQSNKVPKNPNTLQIIQAAIWVSYQDLKVAQTMVQNILNSAPPGPPSVNLTNAAQNSVEYFKSAEYRMRQTVDALQGGKKKDARAWLTAAQVYQYDVWSALKYVNNSQLVNQTMAFTFDLINKTSTALSMTKAYDVFGDNTKTWQRPASERDGYWEPGVGLDSGSDQLTVPADLKPDVTVCKEGCNHPTIQEAVDAAPSVGKRFVIMIKAGVYDESVRVPLVKKNMVFLGEGIGKTIITGAKTVTTPGVSTYNTATVGIEGDGFMASGITVQNTAGPNAQQAVAFLSDSDQSIIENCEFLGNQDTLYAHSLRQIYKSCRIVGNVDFIFGNSATVLENCTILIKPRQANPEAGETNCVSAHGRIDPAAASGFVLRNCFISGTPDFLQLYHSNPAIHKTFLGRPWKEFSRTVYISCTLDDLIIQDGWSPWIADQGLATLYYGEFNSTGLGAGPNLSKRVPWSSQIAPEHVNTYSVENFIQGLDWSKNPPK